MAGTQRTPRRRVLTPYIQAVPSGHGTERGTGRGTEPAAARVRRPAPTSETAVAVAGG